MTTVRFGTDGIRGIAGETLTVEIAAALGAALMQQHPAGLVLLGRDTRPSGAALASALAGAIEARGGSVVDIGVIPTPGLASLLASEPRAACGVVVTASHNPVEYNGLKVVMGGDAVTGAGLLALRRRPSRRATGKRIRHGQRNRSDRVGSSWYRFFGIGRSHLLLKSIPG